MPHPERLGKRTRGFGKLGGAYPASVIRKATKAAAADAEKINSSWSEFDVLVTPSIGETADRDRPLGRPRRAADAARDESRVRVHAQLEPHRPAGDGDPRRVHRRRDAALGDACRSPRRRGDAALARRPGRGRARLGRPPPAARPGAASSASRSASARSRSRTAGSSLGLRRSISPTVVTVSRPVKRTCTTALPCRSPVIWAPCCSRPSGASAATEACAAARPRTNGIARAQATVMPTVSPSRQADAVRTRGPCVDDREQPESRRPAAAERQLDAVATRRIASISAQRCPGGGSPGSIAS